MKEIKYDKKNNDDLRLLVGVMMLDCFKKEVQSIELYVTNIVDRMLEMETIIKTDITKHEIREVIYCGLHAIAQAQSKKEISGIL